MIGRGTLADPTLSNRIAQELGIITGKKSSLTGAEIDTIKRAQTLDELYAGLAASRTM